MIYSAWGKNGVADLLIEGTTMRADLAEQEKGSKLIKTFEAESYEDAMRQYYQFQGWGEYKTLSQDELLELAKDYPPPQSWYDEDFDDCF